MKNKLSKIAILILIFSLTAGGFTSLAAGWEQSESAWKYANADGSYLNSTWVCTDTGNSWYLIDEDGTLVTSRFICAIYDGEERYFCLDTENASTQGMLVHENGYYDGIYIEFSQNHDGSFASITNENAINAINRLGVKKIGFATDSKDIYYPNLNNNNTKKTGKSSSNRSRRKTSAPESLIITGDIQDAASPSNAGYIISNVLKSEIVFDSFVKLAKAVDTKDGSKIFSCVLEIYPDWVASIKKAYESSTSRTGDDTNYNKGTYEYVAQQALRDYVVYTRFAMLNEAIQETARTGDKSKEFECVTDIYPDIVEVIQEYLEDD